MELSPRTPEQNEEIRQQRTAQILYAAMKVYVEKGVRGSEIGEIADVAGIARGLVYHYYKDKMSLFRAMFNQYIEQAIQFADFALRTAEPPLVRLRKYAEHFIDAAIHQPSYVRFYRNLHTDIAVVFEDDWPQVMRRFETELTRPLIETVQEGIHQGVIRPIHPQLMSSMFWGAILGAMNMLLLRREEDVRSDQMNDIMTLAFHGLVLESKKEGEPTNEQAP